MRRLVPATGPRAGWDRDFTIGVTISTLLHAGAALLILWLASRAPASPPALESYTVELIDPSVLGGRLAFGPLDRPIGRPRRIAEAAGGAPAGEPRPGESPRAETAKPPKGADPQRPTRASRPLAPAKPPVPLVAEEPRLPRSTADALVVPATPEVAKSTPPAPKSPPVEAAKAPEPAKRETPAPAPAPKRPEVRLPEPKKMVELPRKAPEPKPEPEPARQARAAPPTAAPPPETKPEPKPEPKAEPPPPPTAITADEANLAASTQPPTPATPSWRNAGPKPPPGPRNPPGVADGARIVPAEPMTPEPVPGSGAVAKPEPAAPAAGVEGTGTGGTPETPVEDEYAAAAERWRSRMAGGAGGMGGVAAATGSIGDGTTDSGGGGSVVGFEFLSYRQRIFGTIKSNWTNSVRTAGLVAAVRFELAPDGRVSNVELVRSSGDRVYDQAVVRAVQRSNPLPPPPERYRDDFREVIVDFHSEEQGGNARG